MNIIASSINTTLKLPASITQFLNSRNLNGESMSWEMESASDKKGTHFGTRQINGGAKRSYVFIKKTFITVILKSNRMNSSSNLIIKASRKLLCCSSKIICSIKRHAHTPKHMERFTHVPVQCSHKCFKAKKGVTDGIYWLNFYLHFNVVTLCNKCIMLNAQ